MFEGLMNYLLEKLFDPLWRAVIRPPREFYDESDLGPQKFKFRNRVYQRKDYQILNERNQKLQCSYYRQSSSKQRGVVVVLHGNSSSRLGAFRNIKSIIGMGLDLFCFDFSGSGLSEGQFVTLGHNQQKDLELVINFIRRTLKIKQIALWGRSMGAATAILYASKDHDLACVVADSPFSDLKNLLIEIACKNFPLPDFLLNFALNSIKETVFQKTGMDLSTIKPIEQISKMTVPIMLLTGCQDSLIDMHHSKDLHRVVSSHKKLIICSGGHNQVRPDYVIKQVQNFISKFLRGQIRDESSGHEQQLQAMILRTTRIIKMNEQQTQKKLEGMKKTIQKELSNSRT